MQKLFLVLMATMIFTACGNKKSGGAATSPEMEAFMKMLDGKSTTVDAALTKYGSTGLNNADMNLYNLESPKVVATNGNCYTMEATSGITTRTYEICWENQKIKTITNKGMK